MFFFKETFLFSSAKKITLIYKSSHLQKVNKIIRLWYHNSFLHRCLSTYIKKEPIFKYSLSYNALRVIYRLIDKRISEISCAFLAYLKYSKSASLIKALALELKSSKSILFAFSSLFFAFGYSIAIALYRQWRIRDYLIVFTLISISIIIVFILNKWQSWLKNSFIYSVLKV